MCTHKWTHILHRLINVYQRKKEKNRTEWTYCNRWIHSLYITLFHKDFPCLGAECFDLCFLYDLTAPQLLNLTVKIAAVTHGFVFTSALQLITCRMLKWINDNTLWLTEYHIFHIKVKPSMKNNQVNRISLLIMEIKKSN